MRSKYKIKNTAPPKATKWDLHVVQSLDSGEDAHVCAQDRGDASAIDRVRKLQLACLEDAIRSILRGPRKSEPQFFEQDVLWVTGQTPSMPLFSFAEICESVDYDAAKWRGHLLAKADEVRVSAAARRTLRDVTRPREHRIKVNGAMPRRVA